jgi:hypothetical protein
MNLTIANATGDGFATVWPCDQPKPATSNINFVGISTIANGVVSAVAADGTVCIETGQSAAHVLVDLAGFVNT